MSKRIYISEEREQEMIGRFLTEAFSPEAAKVRAVCDFLDKTFTRQQIDDIDANGYPTKANVVAMMSADGKQALQTMNPEQLLVLLDDKFQYMFKDTSDRRKFLKQVIKDWFFKTVGRDGILSVNSIT